MTSAGKLLKPSHRPNRYGKTLIKVGAINSWNKHHSLIPNKVKVSLSKKCPEKC